MGLISIWEGVACVVIFTFSLTYMQVRIWEERKVFGSRRQILKEELVGRHLETSNKNEKHSGLKLVPHVPPFFCVFV